MVLKRLWQGCQVLFFFGWGLGYRLGKEGGQWLAAGWGRAVVRGFLVRNLALFKGSHLGPF